MKPSRSLLFVPGHKENWVPKAVAAGTDAVILDLEDSVPSPDKESARECVKRSVEWLRSQAPAVSVYVRPNALETGLTGFDLQSVVQAGLDGLILPKVDGPRDIMHAEALVDHFERVNGVEAQSVHFVPSLESAKAYQLCDEILRSSTRVHSLFAGVAQDADLARSIHFRFTSEGRETLYLRSKALLAMRAAGVRYPLVGLWQDVRDLDGARRFAESQKDLGYSGMVLIHPSHVAIANEVFSLSSAERAYYRGIVDAFDAAVNEGSGAAMYEGQHIDYAHAQTARGLLREHDAIERRSEDRTRSTVN